MPGVLAALDRVAAPDARGVAHRLYNLGNDRPAAVRDFLAIIERAAAGPRPSASSRSRLAQPRATWADSNNVTERVDAHKKKRAAKCEVAAGPA